MPVNYPMNYPSGPVTPLRLSATCAEKPDSKTLSCGSMSQALGLRWLCNSDTLRYKYRMLDGPKPTMINIYRVLARLYDPLGFIVPFTTQAKILVQQLWGKQRDWDNPSLPDDVLKPWLMWEKELQHLSDFIASQVMWDLRWTLQTSSETCTSLLMLQRELTAQWPTCIQRTHMAVWKCLT
ncbi:hypothetical protein VZT92_005879 [Zoarces viviparus]|uniref:Uncharacterized protein n=1 Tax=Zoarces viviparus TaxID=48416 RepID=A0AAW1FMW0_ZOAVI